MNRLSLETSPYLLQHAHNPVDWYAWKPEAFDRAKRENKPILVSIGYSTCHWCHVMERESFENNAVAAFMNQHFINIKVDREERPDVDQIYMEACQIVSGSGGWPLNCFLTPDGKPFFAGTYYPPEPSYGRPSWQQVLQNMAGAFQQKRDIVEAQAAQLTEIIRNSDKNYVKTVDKTEKSDFYEKIASDTEGGVFSNIFTEKRLDNIFKNIQSGFDILEGGFGNAPKFPSTMSLQFLMDYYFYSHDIEALAHVELSLKKMIQGGIYDQIGGGFSRYATDRAWLVPHFEKMLYDNALLINVINDAYKITKDDLYRVTIQETLEFIIREMKSTEGVFYSAYDADSEGVEGKFYVWTKAEIETILQQGAPLFCDFYDVTDEGNWEDNTILWRANSYEIFANMNGLDVTNFTEKMRISRGKLFKMRENRIKPALDNKILLSWNALMISAFARSFETLKDDTYKKIAVESLDFILENFRQTRSNYVFYHTFTLGKPQYDAFLDDYAYLVEAILDVYNITFDTAYLHEAKQITNFIIDNFFDRTDNLFFFTSVNQNDLAPMGDIASGFRKKEIYDAATPSGNSTMLRNLQRLSVIFDDKSYKNIASQMLIALADTIEKYPTSFSKWACGLVAMVHTPFEIAVIGKNAMDKSLIINELFIPNKVIMSSLRTDDRFPLLDKTIDLLENKDEALIFLCQNYTCQLPVSSVDDLIQNLRHI